MSVTIGKTTNPFDDLFGNLPKPTPRWWNNYNDCIGENMKPFKSKDQIEDLKTIPLNVEIPVNKKLKLSHLQINYSITQVDPYYANITYKEKPAQWQEEDNQVNRVEIKARSWPELIDKVIKHFEGLA